MQYNRIVRTLLAATCLITPYAHASYLHVFFNNVSNLGNAYAGEAATAYDASTAFNNPAGLVRIQNPQLVAGYIEARFGASFSGTVSVAPPFLRSDSGHTTSHPHYQPFPLIYYVQPLGPKLRAAIGVTLLGGQGAAFPKDSVIRYAEQSLKVGIADFTPNIAYQINPQLSVGLGFDLAYMMVRNNTMFPSIFIGGPDAEIKSVARGIGYGWHGGFLYQFNPCTRIGFVYHSPISFKPSGTSEFITVAGLTPRIEIVSNNFRAQFRYAATMALSGYHEINPTWAVMGTIGYDRWSPYDRNHFRNIALPTPTGAPGVISPVVPLHLHDTWRLAFGANYAYNPKWLLKAGFSYETSPTSDSVRAVSTGPLKELAYIAIGARYEVKPCLHLELGALHTIFARAGVHTTQGLVTQNGRVKPQRDAIGAQLTWDVV